MPRKLTQRDTFDTLYDELDFTEARLQTDRLTRTVATLIGWAAPWRARVEEAERLFRRVRTGAIHADAAFTGANFDLDLGIEKLGDDLLAACGKDRTAPRFRAIFPIPVSTMNREPLPDQVDRVRGWADGSTDPVVIAHRADLSALADHARTAIEAGKAASVRRAEVWTFRERLAAELTAGRDALRDELARIGREQGLPRDWPDSFFRVQRSEDSGPPATTTPG